MVGFVYIGIQSLNIINSNNNSEFLYVQTDLENIKIEDSMR